MPDVFISYKREERPRIELLAAALTSLKIDVWFDAVLEPGSAFLTEIRSALDASRAVIVCWTPAAAQSAHVLGEAESGRHQQKLIAAFFAATNLPSPFNMIHAEDLSQWDGDVANTSLAWRKILGSVSRYVQRPGLLEFLERSTRCDPQELRRWASDNWKDPLVPEAIALARRFEGMPGTETTNALPTRNSEQPSLDRTGGVDRAVSELGEKARLALVARDQGQSLVTLGRDYLKGFGAPQDQEAARLLFEAATRRGSGAGFFNLGLMYFQGRGVATDHSKARRYFDEAATHDISAAWTNLGIIYEEGLGVARDYSKARAYYERAAAADDDVAIANLAVLHAAGRGVRQNWAEARRLFEKAARMGNASALDNLGTIYAQGHGVEPNSEFARQCFEAAAAQGEVGACYNLGVFHLEGKGGEQDPAAAFTCFEKATFLGHASATANLAAMYANGIGVEPNINEAVRLFKRAGELGATSAYVNLGRIYSDFQYQGYDPQQAQDYFSKACDRGDENGCYHLAKMILEGRADRREVADARSILMRIAQGADDPNLRSRAMRELGL